MTHETPEHMVRLAWQMHRLRLDCQQCDWDASIGYPDLTVTDMTAETRREVYRQGAQIAAMHGWPDLEWQPADTVIARHCDCAPDPTATAGI